jgi:hypothetical protein
LTGSRREARSAVVGEGFVAEEHVPGGRFYVVFAVLLLTSLLLGFYVASRFSWEGVAWSTVGIWLLVAVVAGLAVPDLAQYALLRRFGARPRRVKWFERGSRPLFAWWTTDHAFTKAQFVVSYGVPVLLSSAVLLAYVVRFPTATPVLGLTLPFYLENLWFAPLVLRKPVRTLVQPRERGLRFHEPTFRASST